MGPIYTVDDVIDMVRRRLVLMVVVVALGSVFSMLFALSRPHMYQSTEVIQIAQPRIDDDLVRSTVAGSSARRLQLIQQQLMTRSTLLEIIDAFNLYADLPGLRDSELVNLLRQAVRIEGIAAAREGFADDGAMAVLSITAEMPSAIQAQQVAHEFSQRTINLSIDSRIKQARETLAFFTTQEDALVAEVSTLEDQISAFRIEHDLTLPGSIEFRRDEIAILSTALLDLDRETIRINRAADQAERSERPATARRMLADFDEQRTTLGAHRNLLQDRKDKLENALETSPGIERKMGDFQRQLQQLHNELDVISIRHTEAEVGFRLENEGQAERLTVIEPAALPDYPVTGSRKRISIMGGAASVVLAFALAFVSELRRPVLRTAHQMEREIGFGPVVSIPFLDTSLGKATRWQRFRAWFGGPKPSGGSTA